MAAGMTFISISIMGIVKPVPIAAHVMYSIFLAGFILWCYRSARLGVTIDRSGVVERSLGQTRRIPWSQISDLKVEETTGPMGNKRAMLVITSKTRGKMPLSASARFGLDSVRDVAVRASEMRLAATAEPASTER
ncbi:hypothetical protein [Streptacidiphilus sp. MAP12-20]|uniref:PH domain-containing protein n=1 Tax=Streptacidiphilus sp. MAP12-20 TaxID=3156299 RepID=UPI003516C486